MEPEVAELIATLPSELRGPAAREQELQELLRTLSRRPVPTGRVLRFWNLGTLQARIVSAYVASWLRGRFAEEEKRAVLRNETHLRAAWKIFGSMGYLRGAVMKVGQTLASYPGLMPDELVDTLGALHFEAPPMHFSLLREHVRRELGGDPEDLFAEFDTQAFAAASLGQVHRARLKSGEPVAVKIQYPGIDRTIAADIANLRTLMAPLRLTANWDNLIECFDDIRAMLEVETDYRREAAWCTRVGEALADLDEIVVPRPHLELCSKRVLTLDYLPGVHPTEFLRGDPTQAERDRHFTQILRASFRLWYSERLVLADPNPGNFLFLPDGRLGLLDFGCMRELDDEAWGVIENLRHAAIAGEREAIYAMIAVCADLSDEESSEEERMALLHASCEWLWEPLRQEGDFDLGDPEYLRRGFEILGEILRRRYLRQMPVFTWVNRMFYGMRGLGYAMRARAPYRRLNDEETAHAGL